MKKVWFNWQDCDVELREYVNGQTALLLVSEGDVECIATVARDETPLQEGEVLIKDYSENAGVYQALVDAEVISEEKRRVTLGFGHAKVCDLLVEKGDYSGK